MFFLSGHFNVNKRGEDLMFMMKNLKKIMLLCMLIVAMAVSNVSASPYKLLSSNNTSVWSGMLVSIYGEPSSIRLLDNYESMHDGTVKAIYLTCNVTVTYNAGYGMTEYPASSDEVYVYFKGNTLYAESPYFPDLNGTLSSSEFRSNLNNMLQSFRPDLYSALLQEVAIQKEEEKKLAQQRNNDVIAAIQADPTGRHALPDDLWLKYMPERYQLKEPSLAAYYENNAIHYGSKKHWSDPVPTVSGDYIHLTLKRNDVTNYGQYIIVIDENNTYTCFDYDAANETFIIYDNSTQAPDYSLHFAEVTDSSDGHLFLSLKAKNISGRPYKLEAVNEYLGSDEMPWTETFYDPSDSGFFETALTGWVIVYFSYYKTDGYRLFLQYQSLLK